MKNFRENHPRKEDPLVVGTERYGHYAQDVGMVPIDELEDQGLVKEEQYTDPVVEPTFDEEVSYFDHGKTSQQEELLETADGLSNAGFPHGQSADWVGPVSGVQHKLYDDEVVRKTNPNRDIDTSGKMRKARQFGLRQQPHKDGRRKRSMKSKNAKGSGFKPYRQFQRLKNIGKAPGQEDTDNE